MQRTTQSFFGLYFAKRIGAFMLVLFLQAIFFGGTLFHIAHATTKYSLQVSFSADRSLASNLSGKIFSQKDLYIFTTPETDIKKVDFWIDTPMMSGTPYRTEGAPSYDFAGTDKNGMAKPFDTSNLSVGGHTIFAKVTTTNGAVSIVTSGFFLGDIPLSPAFSGDSDVPVIPNIPTKATVGVNRNISTGININTDSTNTNSLTDTLEPSLQFSLHSDRSAAVKLDGATFPSSQKSVYIFTTPETDIKKVDFWIDDTTMKRAPDRVENIAAFDFAGTDTSGAAKPFDVSILSLGSHTITAKVTDMNGLTKVVNGIFVVQATLLKDTSQNASRGENNQGSVTSSETGSSGGAANENTSSSSAQGSSSFSSDGGSSQTASSGGGSTLSTPRGGSSSSSSSGSSGSGGGGGGGGIFITSTTPLQPNRTAVVNLPQSAAVSSVSAYTSVHVQPSYRFTETLWLGKRHPEVKKLQEYLNTLGFSVAESGVGSKGQETDYFGPATEQALKKFQAQNGVVSSGTPDTTGYGVFGPATRTKMNTVLAVSTPATTSATPQTIAPTSLSMGVAPVSSTPTFTRNLTVGSMGSDVKQLQVFLNTHGFIIAESGPGSPGNESDYFGNLTQDALAKFQDTHQAEVLAPAGIAKGTGYFGPATRAKMNTLLGGVGAVSTVSASVSTSPQATVSAGTQTAPTEAVAMQLAAALAKLKELQTKLQQIQ